LGKADGKTGQLTSSTQDITPNGLSGYYVGDLAKASIKSLNVMSCNGGHLDYIYSNESYKNKGFNHNIAVEFLVTHDINKVYGMDGSLSYTNFFGNYYPRLSWEQGDYYSWTPSRKYLGKRVPTGKVSYWLNDDSELLYWTLWTSH